MLKNGSKCFYGRFAKTLILTLGALLLFEPLVLAGESESELRKRVEDILRGDTVSIRSEVSDVYKLADLYVDKGRHSVAIQLYLRALEVDSWNHYYQLKTARLYAKNHMISHAVEKAKLVFEYAENEQLIDESREFLQEKGHGIKPKEKEALDSDIEIVIIPYGRCNMTVLEEVISQLQKKMGIKFSIADLVSDVGKPDRTYAEVHLDNIYSNFEKHIKPEKFKKLLAQNKITDFSKASYISKRNFIAGCLQHVGIGIKEFAQFRDYIQKLEKDGQYDADKINERLQVVYSNLSKSNNCKGYLGFTELDMFANDHNFLFGWAGKGHGVMSYHRFRADFTGQPPKRPRLVKRTVKQGISSSFHILGIKRCTTPLCARAYPNSLGEHDDKGSKICDACKRKLAVLKHKK